MNLKYKFDKNNDNDPEQNQGADKEHAENDIEYFENKIEVRNLCIVDTNGKETVFYYSDLRRQEYSPDENCIQLFFIGFEVTLKGNNLESLFQEFKNHLPKTIRVIDKRYEATKEKSDSFLTEFIIRMKEN
jgi:hypothetical protein